MDENRDSAPEEATESQRVSGDDSLGDDSLTRIRVRCRSPSEQPRQTPEYHGSWYRNETMREEVRTTVEGQVAWLREIDDKAMRTLRFNAILLGLVVPVFSSAVEFGTVTEMTAFYNVHTVLGTATLVASTALAGLIYTASSIEAGVSSDDVRTARRHELTDKEVHDVLLASYVTWIRSNRKTIRWNSTLITGTVALTIAAFVSLALGLAFALLGEIPATVTYSTYLGLLVVAIIAQIV